MTQQPFTPLVPRPDGRTYTIPAPVPVPELLARIQAHPLDKPGADWPFSERLAQENGWPHGFALRVIDEYRRFVYLACVADEEVTPSDEVDQAWHLHLAYTRDYWDEFCPNVLGRPLHHGPTEGGSAENDRYEANYARTLELYERTFREPPPRDIWPPASIRFDYAYSNVRVNKLLFAIAPKRTFKRKRPWINRIAWVMGAALVAAFVFNIYPFSRNADATSDALVALVICMGIAFWLSMFLRPPGRRDEVITQPQHGYTVAFTVGVVAAAGIAGATVTGVEVSGDGSGEGGSGGGGSGGGGGGNGGSGCGSGCSGGGCGGGGCGG